MKKDLSAYPRRRLEDGSSLIELPPTPKRATIDRIERRVRKRTMEQLTRMKRRLEAGIRVTVNRLDRASAPGLTGTLQMALQSLFLTRHAVDSEIERRTT